MKKVFKIWVDDMREPPSDPSWLWFRTVNATIYYLEWLFQCEKEEIVLVFDLDHDAGAFQSDGGDYIKILDWLEEKDVHDVLVHIHSMNPVGVENMRRIVKRNSRDKGWREFLGKRELRQFLDEKTQ